jgi:BirA family transcriptional regulator, biotin operon repressor / biotin---[acetyl-CoA-carboxylase] ligase
MVRELTKRARQMRREPTEAERRLWSRLRSSGLDVRFVRQRPIGPVIADFACRAARLIVELDGGQHGTDYDHRRDAYLRGQGWRVLRFWNPDVLSNMDGVLETIRLALIEQQVIAPHPSPSRR